MELLAFNFIYGVGFGLAYPSIPKLTSAWTPTTQTGRTTGLFNFALPLGAALVITLTMPVVYPFAGSFQGSFLIWGIPPVVAAIAWWLLVREAPGVSQEVAIRSQTKLKNMINKAVRNRYVWSLMAILFLNEFYMNMMMAWSPALLQLKGASPELAGIMASTIPWAAIFGMLFMPRISDRLGRRKPFIWGPSLVLAAIALIAIRADLSLSWLVMVLVGISIPTRFITTLTVLVELIPKDYVGTASGLLFIGYLGGFIGPYTAGTIRDLTGSFDNAFIVLAVISIITMAISFQLPETGRRNF
jgi:CP family cyanate transporter-like MFS transporter